MSTVEASIYLYERFLNASRAILIFTLINITKWLPKQPGTLHCMYWLAIITVLRVFVRNCFQCKQASRKLSYSCPIINPVIISKAKCPFATISLTLFIVWAFTPVSKACVVKNNKSAKLERAKKQSKASDHA
jgi:hypothetical protein